MTFGVRAAIGVHLRARGLPGLFATGLSGLLVCVAGADRAVFLPFSAGVQLDLLPLVPLPFAFTAARLCHPRRYTAERSSGRETAVRAAVHVVVLLVIVVAAGLMAVVDDAGTAAVCLRNSALWYGLALILCRVMDPSLAATTCVLVAAGLGYAGSTQHGAARAWAWPLLGPRSAAALVLAVGVMVTAFVLDAAVRQRSPRSCSTCQAR